MPVGKSLQEYAFSFASREADISTVSVKNQTKQKKKSAFNFFFLIGATYKTLKHISAL